MFVFFDMDRTLVDFDVAADVGIEKLYELYRDEISMSLSEFNAAWKEWAQKFFDEYTKGVLTYDGQHYACVAKCFELNGHPISEIEAEKRYEIYSEIYKSRHALYSDVLPLLTSLRSKNIPMGLITNGDSDNQRRKLSKLGVIDFFDPIIISSEVGFSKPDARIFGIAEEKCAERLAKGKSVALGTGDGEKFASMAKPAGDEDVNEKCVVDVDLNGEGICGVDFTVSPKEIWYVGDSIKHDVEPAKSRGWNVVYLNRKGNMKKPKIERANGAVYAEVQTLSQVLDVIFA